MEAEDIGSFFTDMRKETEKKKQKQAADSQKMSIYPDATQSFAEGNVGTAEKLNSFYGDTIGNLGGEVGDYVSRLKGNLDKDVAKADLYNQQAGQQRALSNARAGLSGVDTSAMNEQSRRNAFFGAAAINEDAKRQALDLYGNSVSNRIEGVNQIVNADKALEIAKTMPPQAAANGGGFNLFNPSSWFGG